MWLMITDSMSKTCIFCGFINPSLCGVCKMDQRWSIRALIAKDGASRLSCLRYSSLCFIHLFIYLFILLLCVDGSLECSWALRTPYPHHCCVKRRSLILSGLQILLWGPDCVETGSPTHRRLTGPLSVFCTQPQMQKHTHTHTHLDGSQCHCSHRWVL